MQTIFVCVEHARDFMTSHLDWILINTEMRPVADLNFVCGVPFTRSLCSAKFGNSFSMAVVDREKNMNFYICGICVTEIRFIVNNV